MLAKNTVCSQWSLESVQYVCTTAHTESPDSRRVFISDSQGMIGICRYASVPLSWSTPTTPSGAICILHKLTTITSSTIYFQTYIWTITNTPSSSFTHFPSDRQSWLLPTKSWNSQCCYCHQLLQTQVMHIDILNRHHIRGLGKYVWLCVCV